MRRLRRRARERARRNALFEPPLDLTLLIALLTAGVLWRITSYWAELMMCGEVVRFWLGAPGDLPLLSVFFLVFSAFAALWFVNLVRARPEGRNWGRLTLEVLLIAFLLFTPLRWFSVMAPAAPESRWAESVSSWLTSTPFFRVDYVSIADPGDGPPAKPANILGERPRGLDLAELGGFNPANCTCMSWDAAVGWPYRRDRIAELEADGAISPEEAALRRAADPKPVEPDWCPAVKARIAPFHPE